jgi:DNA-binding CsgD family transcriptional regulator
VTAFPQPSPLLDREPEIGAIDRFLMSARGGAGGALVIRGESGIGKSALVGYAIASAFGMTILRVTGVQSEMELEFAGLNLLSSPIHDTIAGLPLQQRDVLTTAFGASATTAPDPLNVSISLLALLSTVAVKQPVLCIVEDVQWLDSGSGEVLALMARRVEREPIALLFTLLEPGAPGLLEGLPSLRLSGLPSYAARDLFAAAADSPVADHVLDRAVAELHGNPLALLELPAQLTPAQLAGDSVLPRMLPLGASLTYSVMRRVRALPADCQLFLLLVAAEPDADADIVWRAAEKLGLGSAASERAVAEGLLRIGAKITFSSRFMSVAVYVAASAAERRRVHAALAATTDAELDPDRSAWHRAGASTGPDEEVGEALERAVGRGLDRGGYPRAALLLERSAQLTPDPHRRAERYLSAVDAELQGGGADQAATMLTALGTTDELQRVRAERLRLSIAIEHGTSAQPAKMLLDLAHELEPLDVRLARDAHLDALMAAVLAGDLDVRDGARVIARTAQSAPRVAKEKVVAGDLLLDGIATMYAESRVAAAPILRQAFDMLRTEGKLSSLRFGCVAAAELWDEEVIHELALRRVEIARTRGARFALSRSLNFLGGAYEMLVGRFDAAEAYLEEAREIAAATHSPRAGDRSAPAHLILSAWRGQEIEVRALAEGAIREAAGRGDGVEVSAVQYARALLDIGYGRYRSALRVAREATERDVIVITTWALPELVEAAARSDELEEASAAVERLTDSTLAGGTDLGLGILTRSRALVADKRDAAALYEEAIERLGRSRATPQLARARLVYGEWLRRSRRRKDAREQLRIAHQMFAAMGADAFAERARSELAATGERSRRWTAETMDLLTPQEARIARLVAEGASNADIAAQLFISPRTVEYHLSKVFRKLGVSSRTQLARAFLGNRRETGTEDQ